MKKILVTGANGQLAKCIEDASGQQAAWSFDFMTRDQLDITSRESVDRAFNRKSYDYCINTAAYTDVEGAESEVEQAYAINALGAENLAMACAQSDTILVHVSTDYVFDGNTDRPYSETDKVNPINVYGSSKLKGEQHILECLDKHYIVRTSWLYSQYGHNFLNTMLRLASDNKELTITTEQFGAPTNANDLAEALFSIVSADREAFGLYHVSNRGGATWYDFARLIFEYTGQLDRVKLAKTNHYRTFAKRPPYSLLDNRKFESTFDCSMKPWNESLRELIEEHINRKN